MAAGTVNNHKSVAIHPNLMILGSISMFFGSISSFLTFSMALDHSITEKSNISPKYDFCHMRNASAKSALFAFSSWCTFNKGSWYGRVQYYQFIINLLNFRQTYLTANSKLAGYDENYTSVISSPWSVFCDIPVNDWFVLRRQDLHSVQIRLLLQSCYEAQPSFDCILHVFQACRVLFHVRQSYIWKGPLRSALYHRMWVLSKWQLW